MPEPPDLLAVRRLARDVAEARRVLVGDGVVGRAGDAVEERRHVLACHGAHAAERPVREARGDAVLCKPPNVLVVVGLGCHVAKCKLMEGRESIDVDVARDPGYRTSACVLPGKTAIEIGIVESESSRAVFCGPCSAFPNVIRLEFIVQVGTIRVDANITIASAGHYIAVSFDNGLVCIRVAWRCVASPLPLLKVVEDGQRWLAPVIFYKLRGEQSLFFSELAIVGVTVEINAIRNTQFRASIDVVLQLIVGTVCAKS